MARTLDPKVIKLRIQVNKGNMKSCKRVITDSMIKANNGTFNFDIPKSRKALSLFFASALAVDADTRKLKSIK